MHSKYNCRYEQNVRNYPCILNISFQQFLRHGECSSISISTFDFITYAQTLTKEEFVSHRFTYISLLNQEKSVVTFWQSSKSFSFCVFMCWWHTYLCLGVFACVVVCIGHMWRRQTDFGVLNCTLLHSLAGSLECVDQLAQPAGCPVPAS